MDINLAFRPEGATHAGKEDDHGSWYKKNDAGDWMFIDMAEDGLTDRQWECLGACVDPGYKLIELPVEQLTEKQAPTLVRDHGGPAFPSSENGTAHTIAMAAMLQLPENASTDEKDKIYIQTKAQAMQGMSLRDYFAAKAMQGMLAVPDDQRYGDRADKSLTVAQWQRWCVTGVVEHAYRVADAMLAARE